MIKANQINGKYDSDPDDEDDYMGENTDGEDEYVDDEYDY